MGMFEAKRTRFGQTVYDCVEHAQWGAYFKTAHVSSQYGVKTRRFCWNGTERYKLGSKSRIIEYAPAFFLPGIGYLDVTGGDTDAHEETLQNAERFAEDARGDVYVVSGAPCMACTWKEVNPVVLVRAKEKPKRGLRLQHDGKRLFFAREGEGIFHPLLMDAVAMSELATR